MIYPTNILFLFQGWFTTRHRQGSVKVSRTCLRMAYIVYDIYIYIHVCTHHISSYYIYRDLKITSKIWVDWQVCWCWHSRGSHFGLGAWNPWNIVWLMVPHLKICNTCWFNDLPLKTHSEVTEVIRWWWFTVLMMIFWGYCHTMIYHNMTQHEVYFFFGPTPWITWWCTVCMIPGYMIYIYIYNIWCQYSTYSWLNIYPVVNGGSGSAVKGALRLWPEIPKKSHGNSPLELLRVSQPSYWKWP